MFAGKQIAVVIPAYNEEKLIARTLQSIPDYVDFIIVVDDFSQDDTAKSVRKSAAQGELVLIRHEQNRGVGGAIVTGYARALKLGADVVAVMAGDAQMDPADLAPLIAPVASGAADYAKGDRLSFSGVFRVMPFMRFIGNHALSILTRFSSGYREVRDSQCGFTAISAAAIARLHLPAIWPRYGFPNDILAHLHCVGARLAQVKVRPIYGEEVSGISLLTAFVRVPSVIIRSWLFRRRMETGRKYPSLLERSPEI